MSKKYSNYSLCNGCNMKTTVGDQPICIVSKLPAYKNDKCPCITCLVKGICRNTCDAFSDYMGDAPHISTEQLMQMIRIFKNEKE